MISSKYLVLTLLVVVAPLILTLNTQKASALRWAPSHFCETKIGSSTVERGLDLNGNYLCSDIEVPLRLSDIPLPLYNKLFPGENVALCLVEDEEGRAAPFVGYSRDGNFRGVYQTLGDLPPDGSVIPGGLNGDADCGDRERRPPKADKAKVEYFAIGDSIASGHGLLDDGTPCRRSALAYPSLIAQELGERYPEVQFGPQRDLACSGARAVGGEGNKSLEYQVTKILETVGDNPTLVSISIGANDFRWSDPQHFMYRLYWQTDGSYRSWADDKAVEVEQAVIDALGRLLERPNIHVVVTEYHNPFNTDSVFFLSPMGDGCMFRDCYGRTDYGVRQLNSALERAVRHFQNPLRVTMTNDVYDSFQQHAAPSSSCGNNEPANGDSWVQYRHDPNSNSNPGIATWFGDRLGDWSGDCFHPNAEGSRQYAGAVNAAALSMGF